MPAHGRQAHSISIMCMSLYQLFICDKGSQHHFHCLCTLFFGFGLCVAYKCIYILSEISINSDILINSTIMNHIPICICIDAQMKMNRKKLGRKEKRYWQSWHWTKQDKTTKTNIVYIKIRSAGYLFSLVGRWITTAPTIYKQKTCMLAQ